MNEKARNQSATVCCRKRKNSQVLSSLGLVNLQPESALDKIRAQIDHQKPEKYSSNRGSKSVDQTTEFYMHVILAYYTNKKWRGNSFKAVLQNSLHKRESGSTG